MLSKILISLLICSRLSAAEFSELIPVSFYGWLDQYSIRNHGFVGREACVPTSSTNACTFLQNINPSIFGTSLSGTTYEDWKRTDDALISLMDTTVGNGTTDDRFVWGLDMYIALTHNYPKVRFSGMFPANSWEPAKGYPKPGFVKDGFPTIDFISNALGAGSALLVGITYNDGTTGGGHELLFNGLTWDPATNTGTAYFVDPLDPSEHYSPDEPVGPVRQTKGDLRLREDGSLELHYRQYHGSLPYTNDYLDVHAAITSALAVGGSFYAPYTNGTENVVAMIEGFEELDPTVAEMIPTLSVLNTTIDLEGAFQQIDPSIYNNVIFSEENVSHQLQVILNNNILSYRNPCFCSPCEDYRLWITPFEDIVYQKGGHHTAQASYRNLISGGVAGLDYFPSKGFLTGGGISYANTYLKWGGIRANSHINSYGAFLYGASLCSPWWVDVNISAFYNKARGFHRVFIESAIPFIRPIDDHIKYKNQAYTYSGHFGTSYDWRTYYGWDIWPFFDLDFTHLRQSSIKERGESALNLHIKSKSSNLLRSELGMGLSRCFCNDYAYLHIKGAYANEYRFSGKKTTAHYEGTPSSRFSVYGVFPQNNLFCATVLLGCLSANDRTECNLVYHGEFGSRYVANEVSAELSCRF